MWLVFAFFSAAFLGFYDVFKKQSLRDNAVIPVLFFNTLFCSLIFLPMLVASALGKVAPDAPGFIPYGTAAMHRLLFLKALLVLSSWALGYVGLKHLPLTLVGPINATRPVLVLLGALVFFGERLNGWQWAGVLVAIVAFYLLSVSGRKEGIRFSHNRWVYCVALAALLGAASGLYDKYLLASPQAGGAGIPHLAVQAWYNLYQCLLMALIVCLTRLPRRRQAEPFRWTWGIVGISLFLTAADFVYFYALSLPGALIAVVSMIRRGSVVVSFAFGALWLRERHIRSKVWDLLLVLLSLLLLAVGA